MGTQVKIVDWRANNRRVCLPGELEYGRCARIATVVVKGDKAAVAECLHPKKHGLLDELAESVSAGLKLAEIHSVFVSGDRVLVATELATITDWKPAGSACTVYTLVKIGESWVIEDVDMENEKGVSVKIFRFKNGTIDVATPAPVAPTTPLRGKATPRANAKTTPAGRTCE